MERKADQLGPLEPKQQYCGKFLRFLFYPIYLRLGTKDTGNPETSIGTDNKSSNKSRLLLAKGLTKRQYNKKENV